LDEVEGYLHHGISRKIKVYDRCGVFVKDDGYSGETTAREIYIFEVVKVQIIGLEWIRCGAGLQ
jgi:hypothetical protein